MRKTKESLLTLFEVVTVGGGLLLLPCAVASIVVGCEIAEVVAQVVLLAGAGTAILTTIALHEGWYADHLSQLVQPAEPSDGDARRVEPTWEGSRDSADEKLHAPGSGSGPLAAEKEAA
ncbi:hypothetical protein SAMN02990966_07237 [Rhodospirillales bacterium URHD0017]|nr:hypothetical protein SAMN02990966_07237 [Rhodospirillales bacterium URHD0017]